jgi:SAM-dependent methyltransferase
MPRDLLIGCGTRRERVIAAGGRKEWGELVTLDNVATHKPDVLHDLREPRLPFDDDSFDELHAYEVLEHLGPQGDARCLLGQFADYWRVLKPGGLLCGTCPSWKSVWAWGDPSHTRIISSATLVFLSQAEYTKQIGKTPMSDFREFYRADFEPETIWENDAQLAFVLRAVKPSRISV